MLLYFKWLTLYVFSSLIQMWEKKMSFFLEACSLDNSGMYYDKISIKIVNTSVKILESVITNEKVRY